MTQRTRDLQTVGIAAIVMLGVSLFTAVVVEAQGDAEARQAAYERFIRSSSDG
jgi:hypothetical protein